MGKGKVNIDSVLRVRFIVFLLFLCIIPFRVYAQSSIKLFSVDYAQFLSVNYKNDAGDKISSNIGYWNLVAKIPVIHSNKGALITNLVCNHYVYDNTDFSNQYPYLSDITSFKFGFNWLRRLNTFSILIGSETRFSSDNLASFSMDHLVYRSVIGLMKSRENKRLYMFGAGVGVSSDFGVPTVMPIIFVKWQLSSRLNYSGNLPLKGSLTYKIDKRSSCGLIHKSLFTSYRLSNDGNPESVAFRKVRVYRGGVFLERYMTPHLLLSLDNGFTLTNKMLLYNNDKEQIDQFTSKPGFFINLNLSLMLNSGYKKTPITALRSN